MIFRGDESVGEEEGDLEEQREQATPSSGSRGCWGKKKGGIKYPLQLVTARGWNWD